MACIMARDVLHWTGKARLLICHSAPPTQACSSLQVCSSSLPNRSSIRLECRYGESRSTCITACQTVSLVPVCTGLRTWCGACMARSACRTWWGP